MANFTSRWSNFIKSPIQQEIFRLAVPNIISNISVPLISSVDTYLMGQQSSAALNAVGLGSMVFNFLYWNMGFLRMGTTGLTAQAYGASRPPDQVGAMFRALVWALIIALLFLIAQTPLYQLSAWAMLVQPEQTNVLEYYSIRMYAAPAVLANMVLIGWSFGMQNARFPLYVTLVINTVNMGVSYWLVKHMNMSVAGAAWGSVAAQYIGMITIAYLLYRRYHHLLWSHRDMIRRVNDGMTDFLKLNVDLFLRTLCLSVVFVLILRYSQSLGADVLSVNLVFMQGLHWVSFAVDGFAYAAESMVGKYKGLMDDAKMRLTIRWCLIYGALLALGFTVVYLISADDIFRLFQRSDYEELKALARRYYIWLALLPAAGWASYIWDGIFVGLTAVRAMRNAMILSFVIFLTSYALLPADMGNHRIWLSFVLFLLARAAFQWWLMLHYGWQRLK